MNSFRTTAMALQLYSYGSYGTYGSYGSMAAMLERWIASIRSDTAMQSPVHCTLMHSNDLNLTRGQVKWKIFSLLKFVGYSGFSILFVPRFAVLCFESVLYEITSFDEICCLRFNAV